tara:strand:- start:120 stop:449 length:330 start_codon:yes stop_codon:yes gene_type:complete
MANSIGKMRYKAELQSPTATTDAGGGSAITWTRLTDLYCNIKPVRADEKYRQGQVQDSVSHDVYIRHRDDISTKYRLVYGSRNFNIKGILNIDERDRYLLLKCQEGVAT